MSTPRVIEFRGKRKDGKWLFGSLINNMFCKAATSEAVCYITDMDEFPDYDCFQDLEDVEIEVIPESVGQFTEMIDGKGNKIFEGDILRCVWDDDGKELIENIVVVFECGQFCQAGQAPVYVLLDCAQATVIGNVTDNPELISG